MGTVLSLILLTLGVGTISLLVQVNHHLQGYMKKNVQGIDMVVGAKGSPLQLILSAVFHIDAPTGNISLNETEKLLKNPLVEAGIPLSYGDSFNGYRIVGTDHQYPRLYGAGVLEGRIWQGTFEVVLGAGVAQNLGLKPGDSFVGTHGLGEGGEAHDAHPYEVVGIFENTHSVLDQLILTATESVWEVHHHEEEAHSHGAKDNGHDDHGHSDTETNEITAMLVKFRSPMGMVQLPRMVNERTNMQAALPVYEINRLFGLFGVGIETLKIMAIVIMAVSGISLFISLYNSLKDRQYEMALMRVYGASRWQLAALVLQEGVFLSFTGFILGMAFSRIGLLFISWFIPEHYPYGFPGLMFIQDEFLLLLFAMGTGLLASIIPTIRVMTIDIPKTLSDA